MKPIPSYPVWLSAFMLLGPFFMVSGAGFNNQSLILGCQIAGAFMVTFALFYLGKRLHEQMEELASLRQLLNDQDETSGAFAAGRVD